MLPFFVMKILHFLKSSTQDIVVILQTTTNTCNENDIFPKHRVRETTLKNPLETNNLSIHHLNDSKISTTGISLVYHMHNSQNSHQN